MTNNENDSKDLIKPFPISLIPEDSWLKRYLDFIYPLTEAPLQYHIATALSIVATVLGRQVYIDAGAYTIYPNLFLLVIGKSGISRKSTAIGMAYKFLSKIDRNLILGSLLSLESIFEAFYTHSNKLALYDEVKALLDNEKRKYGRGLITKFTEFYNCPDYVRIDLKNVPEEKRIIESPCLNLLGATTIDWLQIKETDIEGGFFGRILPICASEVEREIALPPKMDMVVFNELLEDLREIAKINGEMILDNEAKKLYEGLYKEIKESFRDEENKTFLSVFYSRFATHLLKLAIIFKLSSRQKNLNLDENTVLRAFTCMDEFKKFYKEVVASLDFSWEQKQERRVLVIIKELQSHPLLGVPHHEVLHRSHLTAKDFKQIIETLEQKECIKVERQLTGVYYTHLRG